MKSSAHLLATGPGKVCGGIHDVARWEQRKGWWHLPCKHCDLMFNCCSELVEHKSTKQKREWGFNPVMSVTRLLSLCQQLTSTGSTAAMSLFARVVARSSRPITASTDTRSLCVASLSAGRTLSTSPSPAKVKGLRGHFLPSPGRESPSLTALIKKIVFAILIIFFFFLLSFLLVFLCSIFNSKNQIFWNVSINRH